MYPPMFSLHCPNCRQLLALVGKYDNVEIECPDCKIKVAYSGEQSKHLPNEHKTEDKHA